MLIIRLLFRCILPDEFEGMADISTQDLEAIKNISSIMNNGKGTLTDLDITNNLTVGKDLKINQNLNFNHGNSFFSEKATDGSSIQKLNAGGATVLQAWHNPGKSWGISTPGRIDVGENLTVNNETKSNSLNVTNDGYINNIKFSKNWTAYPDNKTDASEIANDTNTFKGLKIVGNKSQGDGRRRVYIYDDLILSDGSRLCFTRDCSNYIYFRPNNSSDSVCVRVPGRSDYCMN